MTAATLPHPALDRDHGDQDAIAVEVRIDHEAAPGDVVPALAALLIDMARKRLALEQAGDKDQDTEVA
jgi:hypothetical protein